MPLDPEQIAQTRFTIARRGYEPVEVEAFLATLAAQMQSENDFMRAGSEVAYALRTLHQSVVDIQRSAELDAARVRAEAEQEAERVRSEADRDIEVLRTESLSYADQLRVVVEREAQEKRDRADAEIAERRATVTAECESLERRTQQRLAETEQLLIEAEQTIQQKQDEANEYLASVAATAERVARARAVTAVQDLRSDLARLAQERDRVAEQLRLLREAIAGAIELAAVGVVELTNEGSDRVDSSAIEGNGKQGEGKSKKDRRVGDPMDTVVDETLGEALRRAPDPLQF
jgi:DivIVA domain-containing protein